MIYFFHRAVLQHTFLAAAFLFSFQASRAGSGAPAPALRLTTGSVSSNGHVKIEWQHLGVVEVQQSQSDMFETAKVIYRGTDKATFVSGLEDGTYYYRARGLSGGWSEPVVFKVQHHSLRLAFILFSLGAIVFALTVFIVVKGALQASID